MTLKIEVQVVLRRDRDCCYGNEPWSFNHKDVNYTDKLHLLVEKVLRGLLKCSFMSILVMMSIFWQGRIYNKCWSEEVWDKIWDTMADKSTVNTTYVQPKRIFSNGKQLFKWKWKLIEHCDTFPVSIRRSGPVSWKYHL